MTEYFLISKDELDKIVSGKLSTKIEMTIRSRPAPAAPETEQPRDILVSDEFIATIRNQTLDDVLAMQTEAEGKEVVMVHDIEYLRAQEHQR